MAAVRTAIVALAGRMAQRCEGESMGLVLLAMLTLFEGACLELDTAGVRLPPELRVLRAQARAVLGQAVEVLATDDATVH